MRLGIIVIVLAALMGPAAGQGSSIGLPEVSYTADMVVRGGGGPEMPMTVYYTPARQRIEMNAGGQQMVIIQQTSPAKAWMLVPSMRMYAEAQSLNTPVTMQRNMAGSGAKLEIEEVGPDTVNGIAATKYRVRSADGAHGTFDGHVWSTDDRIMVGMEGYTTGPGGPEEVEMEVSSLDRGEPDASLFEVPAGYSKSPGGAMPGVPQN